MPPTNTLLIVVLNWGTACPSNRYKLRQTCRHESPCQPHWFRPEDIRRHATDIESTCAIVSTTPVSPPREVSQSFVGIYSTSSRQFADNSLANHRHFADMSPTRSSHLVDIQSLFRRYFADTYSTFSRHLVGIRSASVVDFLPGGGISTLRDFEPGSFKKNART